MTLQRYALLAGAIGPTISGGEWVKHSDCEALDQECEALKHDLASYMAIAQEYLQEIEAWRLVARRKHEMVECEGDFDAAYEAWDIAKVACKTYHDEAIAEDQT